MAYTITQRLITPPFHYSRNEQITIKPCRILDKQLAYLKQIKRIKIAIQAMIKHQYSPLFYQTFMVY